MLRSSATPNAFLFPFPFFLKSSVALSIHLTGKQLHCHVVKSGCLLEPFVQMALISMNNKFRLLYNARKVFDEIADSAKLTVCYIRSKKSLTGFATFVQKSLSQGLLLFQDMRAKCVLLNIVTILGLVPGCTIPLHLNLGSSLHCLVMTLDLASHHDNGLCTKVLDLFRDMQCSGVHPDEVTLVGVLSSCANLGKQRVGLEVEEMIKFHGFESNPFLRNSLISMYARCRNLVRARANFNASGVVDSHHRGLFMADIEGIGLFLLDAGARWSRLGSPTRCCKIHNNVKLAELAFNKVGELEPMNIGYYVLQSNIYSEAGDIKGVVRVRVMMRERGLKKDPRYINVGYEGKNHLFVAGDKHHPQSKEIYGVVLDE
ncbi:putative pentatricopeptide repeat-containing protein, mitochondrial [Salvia divinorum]|uniref:Pentatricopeptide repeat-containing protein, mitochondrial n=1 Tax=Salvia divinorum TaxID=28513 RepID=A0ABD1GNI3_SALDI